MRPVYQPGKGLRVPVPAGRAVPPPAGGARGAGAAGAGADLTVSSLSKNSEIGIQTLVGDYAKKGDNHGKPFYQKVQKIEGHEDLKVFLYFWDTRDGADFSGWWFGDQVGGTQVWARCGEATNTVPRVGWKIPWDAPKAEPGVLLVDPFKGVKATPSAPGPRPMVPPGGSAAAGAGAATNAEGAATVKKCTEQVEAVSAAATEAIETAKALLAENDSAPDLLEEAEKTLAAQQTASTEMQQQLVKTINEMRKSGGGAAGSANAASSALIGQISRLMPKVKAAQTNLSQELGKLRAKTSAAKTKAVNAQKQAESEEKDAKDLEEALTTCLELVSAAEDTVESLGIMTAPLKSEPPEEITEILKQTLEEIEVIVTEGQDKITEARKQVNLKLAGARKYAPETRKSGMTELAALQTKLTEAQKKLNPFKNFQKDLQGRIEAKKALGEIADKANSAELEVETLSMMTDGAKGRQMTDDEVVSAEKLVAPARQHLAAVSRSLDTKMATADGALKELLKPMKERSLAATKTLDGAVAVLNRQREGLGSQEMVAQVEKKVAEAEASFEKCSEAEMPFLKGLENLPEEESNKAIKDCEVAAAQAEKEITMAFTHLRAKQVEAKRYSKENADKVAADLKELQTKLEAAKKKLQDFKKEIQDRKMAGLVADVVESVTKAEEKTSALGEVVKVFSGDALTTVSEETLKEAVAKSTAMEKEATTAVQAARKLLVDKKAPGTGGPQAINKDLVDALNKLQARVNIAQSDIAKHKKAASSSEKLIKAKAVLVEEEAKIKEGEAAVDKVEASASSPEEMTQEAIQGLVSAVASSKKSLQSSASKVEAQIPGAVPTVKAALEKLKERVKKAVEKLDKVMAATKAQREKVTVDSFVAEAEKKAELVEAAVSKMGDAELPFLKGLEVIPFKEASETITASEAAANEVQSALSDARTFVASKSIELRKYDATKTKAATEAFKKVNDRINGAAASLGQFRKDTEGRKKTVQMQEANEKVSAAEAEVEMMSAAVEPFTRTGEDGSKVTLSEEEEAAAGEVLVKRSKATQAALDAALKALAERRQKDPKSEDLPKLQERLRNATNNQAKHKKTAADFENKFVAKSILAEAKEKVEGGEQAVEKATEGCEPLLQRGGEDFLVAAQIRTLASVLREHIISKELTEEALYDEVSRNEVAFLEGKVSHEAFADYLRKLPEAIGRDEVDFAEARRLAIARQIDADGDGKVSLADFKAIFVQRFLCVKPCKMTDAFELPGAEVCLLKKDDEVEALDNPKAAEEGKLQRVKCRAVSSGATGFVTIVGKEGTSLEAKTSLAEFLAERDKKFVETSKIANESVSFILSKIQELKSSGGATGPLADARAEISKLVPRANKAKASLQQVKEKMQAARKELERKVQAEKTAHLEARERKEAEAITAPVATRVEATEAHAKAIKAAATPLTSLQGAEALKGFATPAAVLEETERLQALLAAGVDEVKRQVKEGSAKLLKAVKGPLREARSDLLRMQGRVETAKRTCASTMEEVRKACQTIVVARTTQVASALRAELQRRSVSTDTLFDELVTAGEDRISEAAFCRHVTGLEGVALPAELSEQLVMVCRHIEKGGISRRKFIIFLQLFFKVVKGIAFTDNFEISSAKTLRKAEIGEFLEVLEGPKTDEKLGLVRVKGRSIIDGAEGWMTLKGNQGTPFLQECGKPYYSCSKEVTLEKDAGEGPVRVLKPDEVVELIEGPRKETFEPAQRVRVKAISDGVTGWFSLKDRLGTVNAVGDSKYYACNASIALTDGMDIKNCKAILKLAKGDVFTIIEGPIEDEENKITRVKGKTMKEAKEGWITIKGNSGTPFASEATSQFYTISKDVSLQKLFNGGDEVRVLKEGEAVQVLEGPKEQTFPAQTRLKGRALKDGEVGWVKLQDENMQVWSPRLKCSAKDVPLHDKLVAEGATVVRELALGEIVEYLEGPAEDATLLRLRVCAEKDGATGWVSIKDAKGQRFLGSVVA